ncbi:hypothetical protein K788_0001214 (plasmid) [Paraburkholderia caribensis MBA4]|uniref:Uncharacterized protein n=1 Tax=Paraburkholderia caribensis MBA4 TaxID=1323664 RepID=A0A0P0RNA7_9BURK|nr:hypothetical protein K788_0001214 [Paraburkholderia caribensis MBA4]
MHLYVLAQCRFGAAAPVQPGRSPGHEHEAGQDSTRGAPPGSLSRDSLRLQREPRGTGLIPCEAMTPSVLFSPRGSTPCSRNHRNLLPLTPRRTICNAATQL